MQTLFKRDSPNIQLQKAEYLSNLQEAFINKNEFYSNFVQQDLKALDKELFPPEAVHAREINPI